MQHYTDTLCEYLKGFNENKVEKCSIDNTATKVY